MSWHRPGSSVRPEDRNEQAPESESQWERGRSSPPPQCRLGRGGGEDPAPAAYLGGNPRSTREKWRSEVGREDLKPQSERVTKSVTTWDAGT